VESDRWITRDTNHVESAHRVCPDRRPRLVIERVGSTSHHAWPWPL